VVMSAASIRLASASFTRPTLRPATAAFTARGALPATGLKYKRPAPADTVCAFHWAQHEVSVITQGSLCTRQPVTRCNTVKVQGHATQ
jgi:hypothetical protein